jgi:hypothetical protein
VVHDSSFEAFVSEAAGNANATIAAGDDGYFTL